MDRLGTSTQSVSESLRLRDTANQRIIFLELGRLPFRVIRVSDLLPWIATMRDIRTVVP